MRILDVHERRLAAPAAAAGDLLATLGSRADRLWPGVPAGRWHPMRLDGPVAPGARGGHGPIRYRVTAFERGRSVRFEFEDEGMSQALRGGHRFEVEPDGAGATIRHVVEAEAIGVAATLRWVLLLRPLHDALMEDALDRAERELTGRVVRGPARWSAWVRLLHAVLARRAARRRSSPAATRT